MSVVDWPVDVQELDERQLRRVVERGDRRVAERARRELRRRQRREREWARDVRRYRRRLWWRRVAPDVIVGGVFLLVGVVAAVGLVGWR